MKNYKNVLSTLVVGGLLMSAPQISFADDSLTWNGSFDFYYQVSPQGHPVSATSTSGPDVVEGRYFDRHHNEMTLNMAEVSLKKKQGKILYRLDLAAGEMVDQLSGGGTQAATEPTRNITQATLSYAVNDRLSVMAGKFYSPLGLEVTKAKDNWQYSRSFTYNYAIPFWHEGISAAYVIAPNQWNATLYVLNAWDGRISQEANKTATLAANINFVGITGLSVNYNYMGGAESTDGSRREIHEVNATYSLSPSLSLAADGVFGSQKNIANVGDARWSGVAVYGKWIVNDVYSISPRFESFDDSDKGIALAGGLATPTATAQKINSWTLTNSFQLGEGLEARLELRSDKSDSDLYFKDANGGTSDHQESYAASVLYGF